MYIGEYEVKSVLVVFSKTDFRVDFKPIFKGEKDWHWSNAYKDRLSDFLDSFEEFEEKFNFFKNKEFDEMEFNEQEFMYSRKARALIHLFFLGYSQEEARGLFEQGEFSKLVLGASHIQGRLESEPDISLNKNFDAYLIVPRPLSRRCTVF